MIVVADSSPVNYLVLVDEISILAKLFDEVTIPEAVAAELSGSGAPEPVRKWLTEAPDWVRILTVDESDLAAFRKSPLHLGELQAIALAQRLGADYLILDEKAGRKVARSHGIPVVGTLGVLDKADEAGFIEDLPGVLDRLDGTSFYMRRDLKDLLIKRHRARRQAKP